MLIRHLPAALAASLVFAASGPLFAQGAAAVPAAEPVLGPPTLHSIGITWTVGGDENANSEVRLSWRAPGGAWKEAQPLLRVEQGAQKPAKSSGSIVVPAGARLFAGSL